MKAIVIGNIVIIFLFFIVKGYNYAALEKTKGVVVRWDFYRNYGRGTTSGRTYYPVAKFKGPITTKTVRYFKEKPEDQEQSSHYKVLPNEIADTLKEILKNGNTPDEAFSIIENIEKRYVDSSYDVDEYYTTEPQGAIYFTNRKIGDSINIIFEHGKVNEAIVDTFSSYWVTYRTIGIVGLLCFAWTGIYIASNKKLSSNY
ncbi:MAG: hypothetical protein JST82_12560 [Bacteroidetes bacterium]|nr:hypothetical protein [Bacteroidota bacterium]